MFFKHFITGYGVITTKRFNKGDVLLEYKGNLISRDKGKKLHQKYSSQKLGCYIFDVTCGNKNFRFVYIILK